MVKACGNCGSELDIESIEINEEHFCASEGRKEELDKAGTEYLHHTADGGHILNNYISERS